MSRRIEGVGRIVAATTFALGGLALSADNHPTVAAEPSQTPAITESISQTTEEKNPNAVWGLIATGLFIAVAAYVLNEADKFPNEITRLPRNSRTTIKNS